MTNPVVSGPKGSLKRPLVQCLSPWLLKPKTPREDAQVHTVRLQSVMNLHLHVPILPFGLSCIEMATPHFPAFCSPQVHLFTRNLMMNQQICQRPISRANICLRSPGERLALLYFGQQTLSLFIPNQNRNWPRIRELSLVCSRGHKQLF